MSLTTNFILSIPVSEDQEGFLREAATWCSHFNEPRLIASWHDKEQRWVSGGKRLCGNLFIGAHNNFKLDHFLKFLRSYPWRDPDDVQLFVMEQDDPHFYERFHGRSPDEERAYRSAATVNERKHPDDMRRQGFTIDTCCYPWFAYKGERFNPTEKHDCYTSTESTLIREASRREAA